MAKALKLSNIFFTEVCMQQIQNPKNCLVSNTKQMNQKLCTPQRSTSKQKIRLGTSTANIAPTKATRPNSHTETNDPAELQSISPEVDIAIIQKHRQVGTKSAKSHKKCVCSKNKPLYAQ